MCITIPRRCGSICYCHELQLEMVSVELENFPSRKMTGLKNKTKPHQPLQNNHQPPNELYHHPSRKKPNNKQPSHMKQHTLPLCHSSGCTVNPKVFIDALFILRRLMLYELQFCILFYDILKKKHFFLCILEVFYSPLFFLDFFFTCTDKAISK